MPIMWPRSRKTRFYFYSGSFRGNLTCSRVVQYQTLSVDYMPNWGSRRHIVYAGIKYDTPFMINLRYSICFVIQECGCCVNLICKKSRLSMPGEGTVTSRIFCSATYPVDWELSSDLPFGMGCYRIHDLIGRYRNGEFCMLEDFENGERGTGILGRDAEWDSCRSSESYNCKSRCRPDECSHSDIVRHSWARCSYV